MSYKDRHLHLEDTSIRREKMHLALSVSCTNATCIGNSVESVWDVSPGAQWGSDVQRNLCRVC